MPDTSGEVAACQRCGHSRQAATATKITHAVRRTVGLKPPRVPCGEPTDHGWPCPCRSRFHG